MNNVCGNNTIHIIYDRYNVCGYNTIHIIYDRYVCGYNTLQIIYNSYIERERRSDKDLHEIMNINIQSPLSVQVDLFWECDQNKENIHAIISMRIK